MVRLAWQMLWHRPATMIATFAALFFAVVVVTTCGAMLESGIRFHGPTQRYAAAPVLVATTAIKTTEGSGDDRDVESYPLATPGSLPLSLPGDIAAAPGVRAAISDVAVPAELIFHNEPESAEVHPWSAAQLAPFTLRSGSAPATPDDVVLDERLATELGLRVGEQVDLALTAGTRTVTVSGIAAAHAGVQGMPASTVFMPDDEALAAATGRAPQVIGVFGDPGVSTAALADAVRAVLPPAPHDPAGAYPRVFTGAGRGSVESTEVDNGREFAVALSSVFGGCTLLIAALVIAGTVGLSVRQRHRDIALLRAVAATPRQVRRMVVRETIAVGMVAALAGIWPGIAGTRWLRDEFVSRGMVPDSFQIQLSWIPPLVAGAAAMLIAVAAAWVASLRTSRVRPTEALAETSIERRGVGVIRSLLGLIALAGGLVLCIVSASVTGDGAAGVSVGTVFTLVVAVALLSPLLIRAATALFSVPLKMFGVPGRLAAANIGTSARRLSPVVSSLVLAVALGGSLWFVQSSAEHTASGQARAGLTADYVVTPAGPGLQPAVIDRIRHLDGVTTATGVVHSTLFSPHGGVTDFPAQGVVAADFARAADLEVTQGSLSELRGDTIALDTLTSETLGLQLGEDFDGWYGDGAPARLRVVAIYHRGLGFAAMTVPHDLLSAHTASGLDDAAFVVGGADNSVALADSLRTEIGRIAPGASVLDRDSYQVGVDKNLAQNAWTNQMITVVLMIYVTIGAMNTLIMYALSRRREFAVLRLSGTTPLQVRRMVRLEQALLLGLSLAIGGAIAAATLIPMVKGITGSTPFIPLTGWVAVIGGVILLGSVSTFAPCRRVLRMRPVEAIGLRE